jgi:hypothetical protein
MIFDIVKGTNTGRSKAISCVDLVNFYPEIEDSGKSKYVKALIGCPGYRLAIEANIVGSNRGIFSTSTDRLFTIVGNKFVEMTSAEVKIDRGVLNTSTSECRACDNGAQLLIVDGTDGYIFNLSTNVLTAISDADFPDNPTHCFFTDGYFVVCFSDSGQFYFSASYDGTSWNGLDFATAEYSADTLQGIAKTSNGTLWMIGKQSLELWQGTGLADLPWNRIPGAQKEIGCIAPYSIASNGSQVFWVGNGVNGYGGVFMGSGYDAVRISTPAIENQIKKITGLENATGFVYSDETHSFYVLNFISEKTFVYDMTTGEWHRRGSYNNYTGTNLRQFASGCAFFNGKYYVGSCYDGNIYEMSLDLLDEAGVKIKREINTNYISNENKLLRHSRVEIDIEKGVGLTDGISPTVSMQFSDDNNNTFSNAMTSSPGKIGEYGTVCYFDRLGKSRIRSYYFTMNDAVKWIINSLFIEAG